MTTNIETTVVLPSPSSTYLVLGDLYTLLAEGKDTGGTYGLVEALMQPQSSVALHIHDQMDEAHYILEGEIEYQLDQQTMVATSGTFIRLPKGEYHGFKNIGTKPAKILYLLTPGGSEQFFAEVGQSVKLPMTQEEKGSLLGVVNSADLEKVSVAASKYARFLTS
ncbi:cupin domain-containing protein [Nostoc sp. UHCC 0702]|nr:cupin domain-containing protein [Nostoc sp. UHCC 0702]